MIRWMENKVTNVSEVFFKVKPAGIYNSVLQREGEEFHCFRINSEKV